jgi:trk system potassium uptake protein TrkA
MTLRLIVLGVSTFARSLIEYISANAEAEIIAVDADEKTIDEIVDLVDRPLIGDATRIGLLEKLGVPDANRVLVSVGSIEASLLTLLHLRNLKAQHITVEALSEPHFALLELLKADEVLFPEQQMAAFYGLRMLHPGLHGAREISENTSLVAASVSEDLAGQSVEDIEKKFEIDIVYMVRNDEGKTFKPDNGEVLRKGDLLVLAGNNDGLFEFEKALGTPGPYGKLVPWW